MRIKIFVLILVVLITNLVSFPVFGVETVDRNEFEEEIKYRSENNADNDVIYNKGNFYNSDSKDNNSGNDFFDEKRLTEI